MNRKSLGAVVATALLIVVSILSVIGFQTWFQTYSSQILIRSENSYSSSNNNLNFLSIASNEIYLKSKKNISIENLIISDKNGNEICSYKNSNLSNSELVGYWNFDSVDDTYVYDLSNYNNDGLIFGDLNYVSGIVGNAGDFDGFTNYLNIGNDSELKPSNGFSYSFWIKREQDHIYRWPTILVFDNSHIYYGIRTGNYGNAITFEYGTSPFDGSSYSQSGNYMYLNISEWNYLTIQYDGNSISHYQNGEFIGEKVIGSNVLNPEFKYGRLGGRATTSLYLGQLDEFRIYNNALTREEIKNLMYFNNRNLNLSKGMNKINFNGCNLKKGKKYNLFLTTNENVIETNFIKN